MSCTLQIPMVPVQLVRSMLQGSVGVSWSPDGRHLIYHTLNNDTGRDIWYLSLDGDGEPQPFLETPDEETVPQFSPDGRHVAYTSNETGQFEVYISTFPDKEARQVVSAGGGVWPRWNPAGNELFYVEPRPQGNRLMVAPISLLPAIRPGIPRPVFEIDEIGVALESFMGYSTAVPYDVRDNGQRFMMVQNIEADDEKPSITVVENWYADFKDKHP